jgi:hypothetical protein
VEGRKGVVEDMPRGDGICSCEAKSGQTIPEFTFVL